VFPSGTVGKLRGGPSQADPDLFRISSCANKMQLSDWRETGDGHAVDTDAAL